MTDDEVQKRLLKEFVKKGIGKYGHDGYVRWVENLVAEARGWK